MALPTEKTASHPEKLNWRTSTVDLPKLPGLHSSLAARKKLAKELCCPDKRMGNSTTMDMWRRRQVLGHRAANGGTSRPIRSDPLAQASGAWLGPAVPMSEVAYAVGGCRSVPGPIQAATGAGQPCKSSRRAISSRRSSACG